MQFVVTEGSPVDVAAAVDDVAAAVDDVAASAVEDAVADAAYSKLLLS